MYKSSLFLILLLSFQLHAENSIIPTNSTEEIEEERSGTYTNEVESENRESKIEIEEEGEEMLLPEVRVEGEGGIDIAEERESKDETEREDVKSRKSYFKSFNPEEEAFKFDRAESEKPPTLEIAEFYAEYGIYNALNAELLFGRDLNAINYFIAFRHFRQDGIESTNTNRLTTFPNSDYNITEAQIDINYNKRIWLGGVFFSFNAGKRGLLDNSFFIAQNKLSLSLTWYNEFLFLDKGGISLSVESGFDKVQFETATNRLPALNFTIASKLKFDYLFAENNYFYAQVQYAFQRERTDDFTNKPWLLTVQVYDSFKIVPPFLIAGGVSLNIDHRRKASASAHALLRYKLKTIFSIYASYDYTLSFPSFKNNYVNTNHVFVVDNESSLNRKHHIKYGLDITPIANLAISLSSFVKFSDNEKYAKTNHYDLLSYKYTNARTVGAEIRFEYDIFRMLKIDIKAAFKHFDEKVFWNHNSILDIETSIHFSYEKWGLRAELSFPIYLKYIIDKNKLKAYYFPSIEVEKSIVNALSITVSVDNLFNVQESFGVIPHKGREYFLGLKIKI